MSAWFWLLLLPAIGWDLAKWYRRREDKRFRVLQKEWLDCQKEAHRKSTKSLTTIPTGINSAYRSLLRDMGTNPHEWLETPHGKTCTECGTECRCPDYCKHNMFCGPR